MRALELQAKQPKLLLVPTGFAWFSIPSPTDVPISSPDSWSISDYSSYTWNNLSTSQPQNSKC